MKGSVVSDYLLKNYEDYYAEGDSEWRRLSAIDKAANITSLCENFPHDSILEIGAGEGSILKRLAGEGFGSKFFALEISPTGSKLSGTREFLGWLNIPSSMAIRFRMLIIPLI